MTDATDMNDTEVADPARQAEIDALAAQLASAAAGEGAAPKKRTRRATTKTAAAKAAAAAEDASPAEPETPAEPPEEAAQAPADADGAAAAPAEAAEPAADEATDGDAPAGDATDADELQPADGETPEGEVAEPAAEADAKPEDGEGEQRSSRSRRGRNRSRGGGQGGDGAAQGQQQPAQAKRGRGRGQADDVDPEILEDDVLIPVAGILDVLDNYAFVRTTGYLPGPTDVYVSLGQVKKYGLRKGDAVVGAIRQPRDGEQPGRQKYNALVKIDSISGQTMEGSLARAEFAQLVPVRSSEELAQGVEKGQRVLLVAEEGKTRSIAALAEEVSAAHPDAHLMVVLAGARPEEVTEFRRAVKGEVVVAGFEHAADDHVTVVELAVERAKRLVELGLDVVLLIDSMSQLGRSYVSVAPATRLTVEDPSVVLPAKRLFGSARRIEDGASLTIVATAAEQSAVDRLVVTELSSLANRVIRL